MKAKPPRLLVVAHGSRSRPWVAAQAYWFLGVQRLLPPEAQAELSFLEIAPPLFADRLKALAAGPAPVRVLPFFLSRSGHAGEEIPGMIEEARAKGADVEIIPPEGWTEALAANTTKRLLAVGAAPGRPVVVCGYGASHHDQAWRELVRDLQAAGPFAADAPWEWAPCGHFLPDDRAPLQAAVQRLRDAGHERVAVLPLFLGVASYQQKLMPEVMARFPGLRFDFRPDGILPDPNIEAWAANLLRAALLTE